MLRISVGWNPTIWEKKRINSEFKPNTSRCRGNALQKFQVVSFFFGSIAEYLITMVRADFKATNATLLATEK